MLGGAWLLMASFFSVVFFLGFFPRGREGEGFCEVRVKRGWAGGWEGREGQEDGAW